MHVHQTSIDALVTPRLTARRVQPEDFANWLRMHENPAVMATLGGLVGEEVTRQMLSENLEHWRQHGFGRWMYFDKSDETFVGRGGLKRVSIDGHDEIEVGYALMPEFWGRGLATEIAQASIAIAFNRLGFNELVSFTFPTNAASRRVMEKCGFHFQRNFVWKELPHVLYRLRKTWWLVNGGLFGHSSAGRTGG